MRYSKYLRYLKGLRHNVDLHLRKIGIACITLGLVLFIPLITHYTIYRWEQNRLQNAWKQIEVPQTQTTQNPQPETKPVESTPQPVKYPSPILGRLSISKMGFDDIVLEGTSLEILQYGPGHLENTPSPGHAGNSVIAAHNDMEFHTLGNLQAGDLIHFTDMKGKNYTFKVVKSQIIGSNDVISLKTPVPTLTLSTCYPFNAYRDTPYRYIVTAHLI